MAHEHPIRVLIVEAFEILQHGLRDILDNTKDIQVIGEAADVASALALCTSLHPDVVLMDTDLPGVEGLPAVQAICEVQPHLQVLTLICPDNHHLIEAVRHSAVTGCLTKNVTAQEMIHAIRLVASGKPVMIQYSIHSHQPSGWSYEDLTQREQDVLALLAYGLTNRQIAEQLDVSRFTIKNHVSRLLTKLGATSRTEAAILALQHCIVQMD